MSVFFTRLRELPRKFNRFVYHHCLMEDALFWETQADEMKKRDVLRAIHIYLKAGRKFKVVHALKNEPETAIKAANMFTQSVALCRYFASINPSVIALPFLESLIQLHTDLSFGDAVSVPPLEKFMDVYNLIEKKAARDMEPELFQMIWRAAIHSSNLGNKVRAARFCMFLGQMTDDLEIKTQAYLSAGVLFSIQIKSDDEMLMPHAFEAAIAFEEAAKYAPADSKKVELLNKAFNLPMEDNLHSESLRRRVFHKLYDLFSENLSQEDMFMWLTDYSINPGPFYLNGLRSYFVSELANNLDLKITYLHKAVSAFSIAEDRFRFAVANEILGDLFEDPTTKIPYLKDAYKSYMCLRGAENPNTIRLREKLALLVDLSSI